MTPPVVGIIGNAYLLNDEYPVHAGGHMNSAAVREVAGALPLIVPTDPGPRTWPKLKEYEPYLEKWKNRPEFSRYIKRK